MAENKYDFSGYWVGADARENEFMQAPRTEGEIVKWVNEKLNGEGRDVYIVEPDHLAGHYDAVNIGVLVDLTRDPEVFLEDPDEDPEV